jgi:hypothetical protein
MHLQRTLVAGALLASAVGAHANEISFTFTGHVLDFSEPGVVVDHTGIFGDPGLSLAGESYTAVIRFDDSLGTLTHFAGYDALSTPGQASAVITIKGRSFAYSGAQAAYVTRSSTGFGSDLRVGIYDDASADQGIYLYAISSHDFLHGTNTLSDPFSFVPQPGDAVGETFNIHSYTPDGTFQWARGGLNVESLTVTSVPEPGAWSLLLAGLSGVAACVGRRRRMA